jgi:capsule polysaccharide export protein KpsE/RkpR
MKLLVVLMVMVTSLVSVGARAEVGVTDGCQDEAREVEEDIKKHSDDYTTQAKTEARAELAKAHTNRVNAVKCRKNVQDARQALRQGKRDHKGNKDD